MMIRQCLFFAVCNLSWRHVFSFASLGTAPGTQHVNLIANHVLFSPKTSWLCTRKLIPRENLSASRKDHVVQQSTYYGSGMDQYDMLDSDMLIAVDMLDMEIRNTSVSKKEAHAFSTAAPRGIAHRAFSVFLFNGRNELLLTQRALSKITFPGVWTNTCCSHPLQGMSPSEVDNGVESFPDFPGAKHAAIRKLRHELGIRDNEVPHSSFRFITRFHYWAADTVTYGKEAPWGEHEIDYVLFIKCEGDGPAINANRDEVEEYRYVTAVELKTMMGDSSNLWSPWFSGIMERGGFEWWGDLDEALKAPDSKYCNRRITFFDPPKNHFGSFNIPSAHNRETGVLRNQ